MSWKTCLGALSLAGGLICATGTAAAVDIGQPAPNFALPGASSEVQLAALKGKVVYVDFWASWCKPCVQSFPWMNEMQAKYGARGLKVVAVNVDANKADADAFLAQVPAKITVAFDPKGETPSKYRAKGMPSSYLVGRDGKVLMMHAGFRDDDKQDLESRIRQALGVK